VTAPAAALVAACCVFVSVPRRGVSLGRLREAGAPPGRPVRIAMRLPRRWLAALVLVACLVAASLGLGRRSAVLAAAGVSVAVVARRVIELSRTRRSRRVRQRRVISLCDALSAELRAGLSATTAIRRCCGAEPELAPVVSAALLGGDIAAALRGCGELPGAEGLRAVAAAWDVAGSSGAALAGVLDRMARGLRDDDDARAEVQAALGPPRATAKMLALLPLFGLALGASIGAHPLDFLVGTSWGLACLSGGVVLALLGVWWVERLAAAAEV